MIVAFQQMGHRLSQVRILEAYLYLRPPAITEGGSESSNVDITKAKAWLEKQKNYEVGFKQAKKKCFMSVDKSHLATILELSNTKEMFEALDKKYSATKAASPRQLLRNCQAIST